MSSNFKRILCLTFAFVFLACNLLQVGAEGLFSDEVIHKNLLQKIEFSYYSAADSTAVCYYSDDYFAESSYVYNHSLATMSLSLSFASFGSTFEGNDDYSDKSSNAKNLLKQMGVKEENIEINQWYSLKPTEDSIGIIAGNMPITVNDEKYTLVALAIRGAGYEQEWASNFTLGVSGQHQGFAEGKEQTMEFMREYFENQNIIGKVKLWLTGYSRGAAVANLVSGALDDGAVIDSDAIYDLDDIYTYTFETPAGALIDDIEGSSKYENIFNIINPNDPVPYVAPFKMGFVRYGVDLYIPTAETNPEIYDTLKENMLKFYYEFDGVSAYTVDDFQMKKLGAKNWLPGGAPIEFIVDDTKNNYSQSVFLSKYVDILADEFFIDRTTYVYNYESEIREICSVIFGCTSEQQKVLINSLLTQVQQNWGSLAWSYIWNTGFNPWGDEADALKIISGWLLQAIKDAGITDYDEAVINSAGIALGDLMLALVTSHPNYFCTAVMNAQKLGEAHFPELCFAWMQSLDENYTNENNLATLNRNAYRIIYVEGDTNVKVYNDNNVLVASIVDENPVSLKNNYSYGIDNNKKYVILPIDQNYIVYLDECSLDILYEVKEYNSEVGITRVVQFNVLPVEGETFAGGVPAYPEEEIKSGAPLGSSVEYTLFSSISGEIEKDTDVSRKTEYTVNVLSSDDELGNVNGAGVYKYGETVMLTAIPERDFVFLGWYENDILVSTEKELNITVYDNHNYVGKFACKSLTPRDESGVVVKDGKIYGLKTKLTADKSKSLFYDSQNITVKQSKYTGTGAVFTYYGEEYVVVTIGEVSGDGEITSTDYLQIKNLFLKIANLEGVYREAADVDKDGVITTTDYLRIKGYFLGTYDLFA